MSWHEIAKTDKADWYIHPSGGSIDYETSGIQSAKEVQSHLKKGAKVLEYGCGNGRILRHIEARKVGVDIVPEFVEQAKQIGLNAELISEFKFEAEFDLVYSITVFIHMTKEQCKEALRNIHNALKVGGVALLQIPVYEHDKEPNSFIDVGVWKEEQLREAAKEIGFEVVELHTNKGAFSYDYIGSNHEKLQILKKL